jgi:hypothetical protein
MKTERAFKLVIYFALMAIATGVVTLTINKSTNGINPTSVHR